MKIGIVGTGAVGAACAMSVVLRGSARECVLYNRTRARAKGVATDIRYGTPVCPTIDIRDGDIDDLAGAAVIMITAGVNEKAGGATNRADPMGRLRLLETNARVYEELVPNLVRVAPKAVLLVVTDPPDPLADVARRVAGHDRVISTGTLLDSFRFRIHLARRLGVNPASVEANVIGEHGTTEVLLWSSARVAGVPVEHVCGKSGTDYENFRGEVEHEVRYANITIIEGIGASQYGIGIVSARIAEAIVRDENAVMPVGIFHEKYGVTLSLPSQIGAHGVTRVFEPAMAPEERRALEASASQLRRALDSVKKAA